MADATIRLVDIQDQSTVDVLYKDVGSSLHVPGVQIVGATGEPIGASGATLAVVPTITATPDYTVLDVVGGIITIADAAAVSGRPIKLQSLCVKDKAAQSPPLTFLFFKATPAAGTYTDNGVLVMGAGDMANLTGHVKIVAGDYYTPVSGSVVATLSGIDLILDVDATSLFMLIMYDGALWNAGSTSDLTIELGIERL